MKILNLYRYESSDHGTFGIIFYEDFWLFTLELPWRDNLPNLSCIPSGTYEVTRRYSPSFNRTTYWVKAVPNRSYILIHSASFAGDSTKGLKTNLQGCIALGCIRAIAQGQKCISRSREAIRKFEDFLDRKDFTLVIKDFYVDNII